MKNTRIVKILAGLVVLFILGGVLGAQIQQQRAGYGGHGWGGWGAGWRTGWRQAALVERWTDRYFDRLAVQLSLRPDQIAAMEVSRDQMKAELRELQQETARRTRQIITQHLQRARDQLDETQIKEFQLLQQERRDRAAAPPQP